MNIDGYALVVGGGSGIGKACAVGLAKEGARGVMIADIDLEAAKAAAVACRAAISADSEWKPGDIRWVDEKDLRKANKDRKPKDEKKPAFRAEAVHVDVTKEKSVKGAVSHMVKTFGRIDYCINSAGIGVQNANETAEADAAEFDRFLGVNVTGTFFVTRDVSAIMKIQEPKLADAASPRRGDSRGAIVNIGSLASFAPQPGMIQYTASKHAVLGLSKNAALDNAAHSIRVNCVCPSWVDTPMVERAVEQVQGLGQMINAAVPMGRIALPEEVADAVIFLCSPRSSYVTGCSFIIDGGTALRGIF